MNEKMDLSYFSMLDLFSLEVETQGEVLNDHLITLEPTFRTSVCHIKSSMKKHGFLGINTCHFLGCLRSQLKKLA